MLSSSCCSAIRVRVCSMAVAKSVVLLFLATIAFNVEALPEATHPPLSPPIAQPLALPPVTVRPPLWTLPLAVEGVAYCRSCKLPGYDKILNASPLPGAKAKLVCYENKRGVVVKGKTDKRGYFLLRSPKLIGFRDRSCKVYLKSPLKFCNRLVSPVYRLSFERILEGEVDTALYTAGFHEFAPRKGGVCKL